MTSVVGAASRTTAAMGAIPIRRSAWERVAPGIVSGPGLGARRRPVAGNAREALEPVLMCMMERAAQIPAEQPGQRPPLGLLRDDARPLRDGLEQPGVVGVHAVRASFPADRVRRLAHLHGHPDPR